MATFRDILLQVSGDASDAERTLAGVSAQLEAIADRNFRAHITLSGTEQVHAQAAAVEGELTALGSREVTIPIKLDRRTFASELRAAAAEAEAVMRQHRSGGGGGQFNIGGDAERIGSDLGRAMGDASQGGEQFVRTVSQGRDGVVGFGFSLVGLRSALMGVGVAILVTAAPAIAALGASLVGAAAAAGGMAVALAGALGPAALLVVGAFTALAKVLAAVQAIRADRSLAATTQGHQQAANAALQHTRAVQNLRQAEIQATREIRNAQHDSMIATRSVADAQENLHDATIAAWDAWKQAIDDVGDSIRAVQHAQLQIGEAKLAREDAIRNLQKFRKEAGLTSETLDSLFNKITDRALDPAAVQRLLPQFDQLGLSTDRLLELKHLTFDLAESNLGIKDAVDREADSERGRAQAIRESNRFRRMGIQAYRPLVAAQDALADAQWAQARAQERLNDLEAWGVRNNPQVVGARDALRSATQQLTAATQKGKTALEQVPPELRGLVGELDRFATAFNRIMKPVREDVGRVLTAAVRGARGLLEKLAGPIEELSHRMAGAFDRLFKGLTGDRATGFFERMFKNAGPVIDSLERSMEHLLGFFGNVADAATPALIHFLGWLERIFGAWDRNTRSGSGFDRMQALFTAGELALEHWLTLIGAVGRLILDFFGATSGQSNGMLVSLTATVDKWDEWVRNPANADKIHDAIERARDILGDVFEILGKITAVFIALEPIAVDVFHVIEAIVSPFLEAMNAILDATKGLPAPLREIGGVVAGLVGVGGPFLIWKGLIATIKTGMGGLASLIISRFAEGSRTRRVLEGLFSNLGWKSRARNQAGDAMENATSEIGRHRGRIRTALSGAWRAAGDAVARAGQFLGLGGAGALVRSLRRRLIARGIGIAATLTGVFGAESLAAAAMVSLGATLGLIIGTAIVGALIGTLLRKIPAVSKVADRFAGMFTGQNDRDDAGNKEDDALERYTRLHDSYIRRIRRAEANGDHALAEQLRRALRGIDAANRGSFGIGKRLGGVLPGYGGGDIVNLRAEPGEGILRKEVVSRLGAATINALNAGIPAQYGMLTGSLEPAFAGAMGGGMVQHFHIPPAAPANPQPDPRITAAQLALLQRTRGL